jgi:hypothetical protein
LPKAQLRSLHKENLELPYSLSRHVEPSPIVLNEQFTHLRGARKTATAVLIPASHLPVLPWVIDGNHLCLVCIWQRDWATENCISKIRKLFWDSVLAHEEIQHCQIGDS